MSMTVAELKRIVELLGTSGCAAGLRASEIPLEELMDIGKKLKLVVSEDVSRDALIDILVENTRATELKPIDELMLMNYDDILKHFSEAAPSTSALLNLMKELNYKVSAEDKKQLRKFVARQISETALFSRVASREENNGPDRGTKTTNLKDR